jgi:tetratricopeptide (TPR) repeat protein
LYPHHDRDPSDLRRPVRPAAVSAEEESDRLKGLGNAALSKGDIAGAISMYTASLEKNPQNVASRNNRAQAFLKVGDLKGAAADATAVLKADPRNLKVSPEAWLVYMLMLKRRRKAACTIAIPPSPSPPIA